MTTTIDKAGRIVVPKSLREALNFKPGQQLDLSVRDGHLEVEVAKTPVELRERDGVIEAVAQGDVPTLSANSVRDVVEQMRA